MIVLDTCAALWLVEGSDKLSAEALSVIDREKIVAISAISAFEIGLKNRAGRLELPMPPEEWWARFVSHHRIDVIALNADVALAATRLPAIHRDPADRFIIATALANRCPVVTADPRFIDYGVSVLV